MKDELCICWFYRLLRRSRLIVFKSKYWRVSSILYLLIWGHWPDVWPLGWLLYCWTWISCGLIIVGRLINSSSVQIAVRFSSVLSKNKQHLRFQTGSVCVLGCSVCTLVLDYFLVIWIFLNTPGIEQTSSMSVSDVGMEEGRKKWKERWEEHDWILNVAAIADW